MLISPIGRGILTAFALLVAIVWMSWTRAHPPTAVVRTSGEVVAVETTGLGTDATPVALVRLEDGREARVMIGGLVPRAGQVLPFVIEEHSNGDAYVAFDRAAWLDAEGEGARREAPPAPGDPTSRP